MADALGFAVLLAFFLSCCEATHFAFGTYQWHLISGYYNQSQRSYWLFSNLAFRASYFGSPYVGEILSTGATLEFYPMGQSSGSLPLPINNVAIGASSQNTKISDSLTVKIIYVDDWFSGTQNTTVQFNDPSIQNANIRHYYSQCCRVSAIREANHDVAWTLTGVINRFSHNSAITTGLSRISVQLNLPFIYDIPWIHPDGYKVQFFLSQSWESTLPTQQPYEPPSGGGYFNLNGTTGRVTWTPDATGLYAVAFIVEDLCENLVPPAGATDSSGTLVTTFGGSCNGPAGDSTPSCSGATGGCPGPTTGACCSRIPLDFIFSVLQACTSQITTNCVSPPWFYAPWDSRNTSNIPDRVENFYVGIGSSFLVCAQSPAGDTVTAQSTLLPTTATFIISGFVGLQTCYRLSWTPNIGDVDTNVCFIAITVNGGIQNFNQYCILLHIIRTVPLVVPAIIRDFHAAHKDFNLSTYGDNFWTPAPDFVQSQLDANGNLVYNGTTTLTHLTRNSGFWLTGNTGEGFYDWFYSDSTLVRNYPIFTSLYLSNGLNPNLAIYSFLSAAYFPIDGQGYGNEGMIHNYFYTIQIPTYLTYLPGENLTFAAADDLWVFVDSQIPGGWNQYGYKQLNTTASPPVPYNYVLNMDQFAVQFGLTVNETYRCDIFYANRGGTPYLRIDIQNYYLCNGLTQGTPLFNFPNFTYAAQNLYFLTGSDLPTYVSVNRNGTSVQALQLQSGAVDSSRIVWYKDTGSSVPTIVKILHGTQITVDFQVNTPGQFDGFAILLSNNYALRGGAGPNLGYGGGSLIRTLAIEIDGAQTAAFGDPVFANWTTGWWGQVSFHSGMDLVTPVSAEEFPAAGGTVESGSSTSKIQLNFQNGTAHKIIFSYTPAQYSSSGPNQNVTSSSGFGFLRVFIPPQLEAVAQTQVSSAAMVSMFSNQGAYVGLSSSGVGGIQILDWSVVVVAVDPSTTTALTQPQSIVAGNTGYVTVQAEDACASLITSGGDSQFWSATYNKVYCGTGPVAAGIVDNGDGTYTFSYNPVIAGAYTLSIQFNNISIQGSPFTFDVTPALPDPTQSFAVFGQIPDLYRFKSATFGVAVGIFAPNGILVNAQIFDFYNTGSDYYGTGGWNGFNSFIASSTVGDYISIALIGSQQTSSLFASASFGGKVTSAHFSSIKAGDAFAFVGQVGTSSLTCAGACEVYLPGGLSVASVSAIGTDSSSVSFTRVFNITAISANDACGPYGRINSIFNDVRVPAGSTNYFTVQSHDQFGNLNPNALISPAFNGTSVSGPPTQVFSYGGYFEFSYSSVRAGTFYLYTNINYQNIFGSPNAVTFVPGLANCNTSYPFGGVLSTATAGTLAVFQIYLADFLNNTINYDNPLDMITANVVASDGSPSTSVNLTWITGSGCSSPCLLQGTWLPTLATTLMRSFSVVFVINGCTKTYASPIVVPGPLYPPYTVIDPTGVLASAVPAGSPVYFYVQAVDKYNNTRITPNNPGDVFTLNYSTVVTAQSSSYAGAGEYLFSFIPEIKGPESLTMSVVATGNGDVKTHGVNAAGPPYIVKVKPGPAGPPSKCSGLTNGPVRAGTLNSFTVVSLDKYSNLRDSNPYGAVASPTDYIVRIYIPVNQLQGLLYVDPSATPSLSATGNFTLRYNCTIVGNYTVSIQDPLGELISCPTTIAFSPVTVIPDWTYPINTQISGAGVGGGRANSSATFSIVAEDIWGNTQIDWHDVTNYSVSISQVAGQGGQPYAGSIFIDSTTLGGFIVNYTVPVNPTSNNAKFNITLCHTGGGHYAPWCVVLPAISAYQSGSSFATITVVNGTAGVLQNYTIDDHAADNTPIDYSRGDAFTVTLTKTDGSGSTISPIIVGCRGSPTCVPVGNNRSIFDVTFTPTVLIGTFRVRIFEFGFVETQQSSSSPVYVTIFPGPVWPPNCVVAYLSATAAAGSVGFYEVTLYDQWNHLITNSSLNVSSVLTYQATTKTVTLQGAYQPATNAYRFTYNLTTAGTWSVQIQETQSLALTGNHIGIGLTITVTPGNAWCTNSYVVPIGSNSSNIFSTAGDAGYFQVFALDQWNNTVTNTSTTFTYSDSSSASTVFNPSLLLEIDGGVTFSVAVNITKIGASGSNVLNINLPGCGPLLNSPQTVYVNPAAISPSLSQVTSNASLVTAGQPAVVTIHFEDIYGNNWYSNGASSFLPIVTTPKTANLPSQTVGLTVAAVLNASNPGTYSFTLPGSSTTQASNFQTTTGVYIADYNWAISAAGVAITPTLYIPPTAVEAGPTDPSQTIAPTLVTIEADQNITYSVLTQDQYGNQRYLSDGHDTIVWNFTPGTVDCTGESQGTAGGANAFFVYSPTIPPEVFGVYSFTLVGSVAGKFTANITTNGGALSCAQIAKLVQVVIPGPGYPPNSTWDFYPSPPPIFQAGTPYQIRVQVNDRHGNPILRGNTSISIGNEQQAWKNNVVDEWPLSTFASFSPLPGYSTWLTPASQNIFGLPNTAHLMRYTEKFHLQTYPHPPDTTVVEQDLGNSTYIFTITDYTESQWAYLVLSFANKTGNQVIIPPPLSLKTISNGPSAVTVIPGPPRQFTPDPPSFASSPTAAIPNSFTLQAEDFWGNPVTTNNQTYTIVAQQNSNGYTIPIVSTPGANGTTTFTFLSAWHGNFTLSIVMHPGDPNAVDVISPPATVSIAPAPCGGSGISTPYRCLTRQCVASYMDCPSSGNDGSISSPVSCAYFTSSSGGATDASQCGCPAPLNAPCHDGTCAPSCPSYQTTCPIGLLPCSSAAGPTGLCRINVTNDCPSVVTCPPGYLLCPDGISCSTSAGGCTTQTLTACPNGGSRCSTGSCVNSLDDCPTQVSCGAGMVLCGTDGSCQPNRNQCPDQYPCFSPTPYRCPTGACRVSADQCPTPVTCPATYVKCEDNTCARQTSLCQTPLNCSLSEIRCGDGSCAINQLFCPSQITCPPSAPVLCWDGSCVSAVSACVSLPSPCGTGQVSCPGGACASTFSLCPTGTRCTPASPVLCSDGSCQNSSSDCPILPTCGASAPVKCPDGLSCRGALINCPTGTSCPLNSVKCSDGTCAIAFDVCAPVTLCPNTTVRCGGGECSSSYSLCPTHETCPTASAKCQDGTCRTSCQNVVSVTCPIGNVTCPQAGSGIQCAPSLVDCPSSFICPASLPVRCLDSSCADDVSNCPSVPTSYPTAAVPCPDGTWASTLTSCPTPITCPSLTPYKCYDSTCRIAPADCPIPAACGQASGTPYLCGNGACTTQPYSTTCFSASGNCPNDYPIACPNLGCVANATDCNANVPLNCTGSSCTICPAGYTYCKSGACVENSVDCPAVLCPASLPIQCPDGLCVTDSQYCNTVDGCPYYAPLLCPTNGACINNSVEHCAPAAPCPSPQVACISAGGYCAGAGVPGLPAACLNSVGCADNTQSYRCYDGRCAASLSDCTNPALPYGTCPQSVPFRCADGFCAKSSVACPYQTVSANCPPQRPIQCAISTCVLTSSQCPPVFPCASTESRCGDGTCRPTGVCPLVNTCPSSTQRCANGLCTNDTSVCNLDPFTGCPITLIKCPSGECAANLSACAKLPAGSGCPTNTPISCYNGVCVASLSLCNLTNNCPQTLPNRCASNGACMQYASQCPTVNSCTYQCADGSCSTSPASCISKNGCPTTTPIRCPDGTCQTYPSGSSGSSCTPTVVCNAGLLVCLDGTCVSSSSLCQPVSSCPTGQVRCGFACRTSCTGNGTSVGFLCPASNGILCLNGKCVSSLASCGSSTGGLSTDTCTSNGQVTCVDGSCAASYSTCVILGNGIHGTNLTAGAVTDPSGACTSGLMCPNGLCVAYGAYWFCPIIPRCPNTYYRCDDGTCKTSESQCPQLNSCTGGLRRCEDGWCRSTCLGYDGCGLFARYYCSNMECSKTTGGCAAAASGNPLEEENPQRRLLATSASTLIINSACTSNCQSQIKATSEQVTIDITQQSTVDIALNSNLVPVAYLTFPAGALTLSTGGTTAAISIRPVPESRMRMAVNEIHPSRVQSAGNYLPFSLTVLSVAFECVVGAGVAEPFNVDVTYTAWIDQYQAFVSHQNQPDPRNNQSYGDVCLARLVEEPGFSTWFCLVGNYSNREVGGPNFAHPANLAPQVVEGVIHQCSPLPDANGSPTSSTAGTVYAFIYSPLPISPQKPAGLDVVQRNIVWIILGVLLGIVFLILLCYMSFRLFRYRDKYHNEKEEADRLHEEVENMRQFGGDTGVKDDQVAMTPNPLSVQLQDVQARYNAEDLKLQEAESHLRKQEGEIRQEHIKNMRDNRDKLADELDKLRRQLAETQAASAPKPTYDDTTSNGPTYTNDEPVREEFEGGALGGAQPRRGKRDL